MVRRRRIRQHTLDPGESIELDGTFKLAKDADQSVRVHATVRSCGDEDSPQGPSVDKDGDSWKVVLAPDTTLDVDGLEDADGVALVLAFAATPCPEDRSDESEPDEPPVVNGSPDVVSDDDEPPVWRDKADVQSYMPAFDDDGSVEDAET